MESLEIRELLYLIVIALQSVAFLLMWASRRREVEFRMQVWAAMESYRSRLQEIEGDSNA